MVNFSKKIWSVDFFISYIHMYMGTHVCGIYRQYQNWYMKIQMNENDTDPYKYVPYNFVMMTTSYT